MKLKQTGNIVTGSYYYAGGQIQGTASGNDIYGNWLQNNHKSGTFDFSMTADCKALVANGVMALQENGLEAGLEHVNET